VAAEGWGTPFYGDDPCASLDAQQAALLASWNKGTQIVYRSRADAALGWSYILGHPGQYLKLSVRRAWTMFDPWHPRQHLRGWEKWAMLLYFLVFIAPGVVGAAWVAMRGAPSQAKALYVLLLASYAPWWRCLSRTTIGLRWGFTCFLVASLGHGSPTSLLRGACSGHPSWGHRNLATWNMRQVTYAVPC